MDNGMKIHSDEAWDIASQYSYTLASDTRTLAAQIDALLFKKAVEALTTNKFPIPNGWSMITCIHGDLDGHKHCNVCDGAGWHYYNKDTKTSVSDMMRDAMERHG